MLCFLVKPLATNIALYFSIDPSGWYFFLKIHLQPMSFTPLGRSTKVHVLFFLIESSSVLMALSQLDNCKIHFQMMFPFSVFYFS